MRTTKQSPRSYLAVALSLSLFLNIAIPSEAQAKFLWFGKKNNKTEVTNVEEYSAVEVRETPDEIKTKLKTPVPDKIPTLRTKKTGLADYNLPVPEDTSGFHPIGHIDANSRIQGGVSQDVMQLSLADCLELAIVNNPKIASAKAMSQAYNTKKMQAASNYTPSVNFTAGVSRIRPDSGTSRAGADAFTQYLVGQIGVSQLIYDFGQTQNLYKLQKWMHFDTLGNIADVVNTLIYNVKDAYFYLLYITETVKVMEESVEYFQQTYNQANAFWQVGTKAKIDVTIAEVNLANARADLIQAKGEVEVALARLNNAMGLPFAPRYEVNEKLPFEESHISLSQAVEIANKYRPDILRAAVLINIQDQALRLQRKAFYPAIAANANWSRGTVQGESQRGWWDAGVYMSFPTVNPVLLKAQFDEAKYTYVQQTHDSKDMTNNAFYDIQSAYEKAMYMQDRIPAAEVAVKKAWETFELASGRYKVGEGDAIELKDSQLQYQNARLAYYATLYSYNNAKSNLERAVGKSISSTEAIPQEELPYDMKI